MEQAASNASTPDRPGVPQRDREYNNFKLHRRAQSLYCAIPPHQAPQSIGLAKRRNKAIAPYAQRSGVFASVRAGDMFITT